MEWQTVLPPSRVNEFRKNKPKEEPEKTRLNLPSKS
jgi:hypothetical protein